MNSVIGNESEGKMPMSAFVNGNMAALCQQSRATGMQSARGHGCTARNHAEGATWKQVQAYTAQLCPNTPGKQAGQRTHRSGLPASAEHPLQIELRCHIMWTITASHDVYADCSSPEPSWHVVEEKGVRTAVQHET